MIYNRLAVVTLVLSLCFANILSSCSKINEATEIGGDLIPAVDNITTFDTTISVETYNGLFSDVQDSTKSTKNDQQFIGATNDPLFGKTEASMFLELKPNVYPYAFPFKKDSLIGLDSIVLVLGVNTIYGDSNAALQLRVFEIEPTNKFRYDSSYLIRKNNFTLGQSLGPAKTFVPNILTDFVFPKNEIATDQLRIKLDNSFGQRLLNFDSTREFATDSALRSYFNGFAVVPQSTGSANALIGINLADTNTKLAFYYKFKNGRTVDTVTYFKTTALTASANYINRDRTGSQLATYQGGTSPDNLVFIQNTPGSFATIKIPALSTINNLVIHRAELIMEQVYDPSAATLLPPDLLYIDAFDSAKNRYRTIPFDVLATPQTLQPYFQISNVVPFGMAGKKGVNATGNPIYTWKFNITRYVQNVLTKAEPLQDLRVYSPYIIQNFLDSYNMMGILFGNSSYAIGQVRLGGGNNAAQPMRLRLIYSKL